MLFANNLCAAVPRRCMLLKNYSDYVRKTRILKNFLKRADSTEDVHSSAKYIVTLDEHPLIMGNPELCKMDLRILSFPEIQEKLGQREAEGLKQKSVFLDVVGISDQQYIPVYGFPLQQVNLSNDDSAEKIREQLGKKLAGCFVRPRFVVSMLRSDTERDLIATMLAVNRWIETYKYCPRCTAPLEISLTRLTASCLKCSKTYYPSVSPVAICLVTNPANTHALLVQHMRNPKSVYTCIAGFAQVGESLTKTVHREVAEEVGIECRDVMQMNMSQWWPFPDGSLMLAYHAIAEQSDQLTICEEELQSAHWFTRDDVRIAYENTVADPTMRKYVNDQRTEYQFHHIPPSGTVAHQMIKCWLDGRT